MKTEQTGKGRCLILGASHAGVNVAFHLRQEGWTGEIILIDGQGVIPYHRPPLSKTLLSGEKELSDIYLKPEKSYINNDIQLTLGKSVASIHKSNNTVFLNNGEEISYDKLVLATGANPLIPPVPGLDATRPNIFLIRTQRDISGLKSALTKGKKVAIIGGGYIGLEVAASLKKVGLDVSIFEREERLLSRVTSPVMSDFFKKLHESHGVLILTSAHVDRILELDQRYVLHTDHGKTEPFDIVVVGTGITPNLDLAYKTKLDINDGILVDQNCTTSHENIWAAGDCTRFFSKRYNQMVRLESVQNATDQAKVVAASICGKDVVYDPVPWFWSDQFDVKLQIAGLSTGYTDLVIREKDKLHFSVWYFNGEDLLSVDAVNDTKSYVASLKAMRSSNRVNKEAISDLSFDLKNLV